MSIHNLRSVVANAATASLFTPVTVRGNNTYTFGTNLLSWDEVNNYTIDAIAPTFGQTTQVPNAAQAMFKCGDSAVSAFDFGLLFSCFTAIVGAYTEQGASVFTSNADTSIPELDVVWFGNNAVLYCLERNLIIPIKSADVQNACRNAKVHLDNFVDIRSYQLTREKMYFVIDTEKGENLCRFPVPLMIQRAFPNLFDEDLTNDFVQDDPSTPWDERSQLGSLIASSASLTSAEDTAKRYRDMVALESVVVRSDLIMQPSQRYKSTSEFLGSLCYSDKDVIALAVNFRNNLFVYRPWFTGEKVAKVQVDSNPQLGDFFNISEECKLIERYAQTVTNVPLTAAQLDVGVFEKIKTAFYNMELPRLKLASAFGRIVIPESVLVKGLGSMAGESVFCLVMLGVIGKNVICKTSEGSLTAMSRVPWLEDEAFYDITEVVR